MEACLFDQAIFDDALFEGCEEATGSTEPPWGAWLLQAPRKRKRDDEELPHDPQQARGEVAISSTATHTVIKPPRIAYKPSQRAEIRVAAVQAARAEVDAELKKKKKRRDEEILLLM